MSYIRIPEYYKYITNVNQLLIVPVKNETRIPYKVKRDVITTSMNDTQLLNSFQNDFLFKNPMIAGEIRPIHKEISKNMNEVSF